MQIKSWMTCLMLLLSTLIAPLSQAKPLLTAFYYCGNIPLKPEILDVSKTAIQHLDILIYSASIFGLEPVHGHYHLNDGTRANLLTLSSWLKKNSPHTKLMLSLGYWHPPIMRQVILDEKSRNNFVNAIISLLKRPEYHLSGIGLDWENIFEPYPLEIDRFPLLVQRLRHGLHWNGLDKDLITVDLPAPQKFVLRFPDPQKWIPYVDWANLMAYEYYGDGIPYAELDATLGKVTAPYANITPTYATSSLIDTLALYKKRGIPNRKMVIIMPLYATGNYIRYANKAHNYGLRELTIIPEVQSFPYWEIYSQYGIQNHIQNSRVTIHDYTFTTPDGAVGKHSFWITYKRHLSFFSFSHKRYLFITYPDPISFQETAAYLMAQKYRGFSAWDLTDDLDFDNQHSLLRILSHTVDS